MKGLRVAGMLVLFLISLPLLILVWATYADFYRRIAGHE
jgi:hypothetical protein